MNRRTILVGAGGIGAATIGGVALFGGSAAAEVGEHEFTGTTIRGESDDGSLDDVRASAHNIHFSYEGLDEAATEATVELRVVYDGETETIDEETREDLSGTSQSNVPFGYELEGSILDHSDLDASDFEADEDGSETNFDEATLRLEVTVDPADVSGHTDAFLDVVMQNIESDGDVGGDSDGEIVTDFEHLGQNEDGTFSVYANYENSTATYLVEFNNEAWPASEDVANFNLNFDVGEDGDAEDYQVGYHHGDDGEDGVGDGGFYKVADGGDRDTFHENNTDDVEVTVHEEFASYEINVDYAGVPEDEESYQWAANASDGGEGSHLNITTNGEEPDWSEASNFRTAWVDVSE